MKNFFAKIKIKNAVIVIFAIALTLFSSCSNSQSEIAIITIDTGIDLTSRRVSGVESYRLTVSATDMETISKTFTESKISLTLYKGNNRLFTLEALNESGETVYKGSQTKDLYGKSQLEIFIVMSAVDTDIDSDEPVIPITILVDGFGTFLKTPPLSWEPLENSSYKFRYAESIEALLTAEEIKCETNSYTFSEELLPGTYYWQCCSVVNEKTSDWSQALSFTINQLSDNLEFFELNYAYDLYYISFVSNTENDTSVKDKNFKLMVNINMDDLQEDQPFKPIGGIYGFQATFDGNNKTISNLKIDSTSDHIGLFNITNGATIKNLTLKNVNISGSSRVGGLAGYAQKTNFSNCHVSGSITATVENVGGLAGMASGTSETIKATIENCTSSVNINTESNKIGGLVGYADSLIINNCYNNGDITGNDHVGGLVGRSDFSNITNCFNTGVITGNEKVGGLVGDNYKRNNLTNSYNMGDVYGNNYSGGLVGNNVDSSSISNCYVAAGVYGKSVTYTNFGALIGFHTSGTIGDCYFDSEKCNLLQIGNREGNNYSKTTIEMKNNETYSGWDFDNTWGIESNKNNGYPYLLNVSE